MAITLTLTDDQALEIVAQLGNALKRAAPTARDNADDIYGAGIVKAREYIETIAPGVTIRPKGIAESLGIQTRCVSCALGSLKRKGQVEMIQKGTWRRI